MKHKNRAGKLNIIEPWELGTDKAIETSIVDYHEGQYLFYLFKPLPIKGKSVSYLVGELRDKEKSLDLFSDKIRGTVALNMVYSDEVDRQNFRNYRIKDFRGNFLSGEVILS